MLVIFLIVYLLASEYFVGQATVKRAPARPSGEPKKDSVPEEVKSSHTSKVSSESTGPIALVPAQSQVFQWANLSYEIKTKKQHRVILSNIDRWVTAGTLTALMGVTGAGKTSLLNALAGWTMTGTVSGDILINGLKRNHSFQRKLGYVQQDDNHLPTSTVREALQFSAFLRQPQDVPQEEKVNYVDEAGGNLNVEQRKRLTIAVEMAAKPEVLLFLGNEASTVIRYFEPNGASACPAGVNPAEWMLDVTGVRPKTEDPDGDDSSPAECWSEKWISSEERQEVVFIASNVLMELLLWQTIIAVPIFVVWYYSLKLYQYSNGRLRTTERVICRLNRVLRGGDAIATLIYWLATLFYGILTPPSQLARFWIFMYRVSPLTYLLEGLAVAGLADIDLTCSSTEVQSIPVANNSLGLTCGEYLSAFVRDSGERVLNPSDPAECHYCPVASVNTILESYVVANMLTTFEDGA
ncbi:unnamed protein product [Clonostachys byssicola]|uniref:AAA+ ATPase domain-containing protein n=1 Tax=Clonostachys byssicola TaxID=160290 RepID=A0A9N9UAL7_9HYPO|nr:unnamed protein product [Clonostachys byssicola]